ncbi:methyltransferase domain-containing protein [Paramicrobacterium agarici]|uniref:2-polyprenyl-3-methyl-5-hydroxy-6-metoxy-1, 4-benzoquinol methylase n=1 Tax=Paramicrobacterium agarici TaxID=630514 RepID=A0A2A9DT45_9MICO|nr:methyltransferase domain-containing protein [Microbacterium agarici]PFG29325.1 2-polyprenyl-3-methyl-5-hydroxy-6-metoxy-1,4-benzoquinol methylase [Microbacterium agarici]
MVELDRRDSALRERMDDPDCDPARLRRTYRRFDIVNRLVAGWRHTYIERLRPRLAASSNARLLDVGCGAGDVTRAIERWARRDGLSLEVTGVDPDPVAIKSAEDAAGRHRSHARFLRTRAADLDEQFDVVISNHVLHHIADLPGFLDETLGCCARDGLVVHSDIERSRFAYLGFSALAAPLTPGTFIREDGLLSIRRSYTAPELRAASPEGWLVDSQAPSRLLLHREAHSA